MKRVIIIIVVIVLIMAGLYCLKKYLDKKNGKTNPVNLGDNPTSLEQSDQTQFDEPVGVAYTQP